MAKLIRGGKIADPIREMLKSDDYNGVIFRCDDAEQAETVRMAALMLRWRNKYPFKTSVRDSKAIVYKEGYEYEPECFQVNMPKRRGET